MESRTLFILVCCFLTILLSIVFGDGSINNLKLMRESLSAQKIVNEKLSEKVQKLSEEATRLKTDDRFLEKTVRNELGLTRKGELVFIFEDGKDSEDK